MSWIEKFKKVLEARKFTPLPWKLDEVRMYLIADRGTVADTWPEKEGDCINIRGFGAKLPMKDNGEYMEAAANAAPELLELATNNHKNFLEAHREACRASMEIEATRIRLDQVDGAKKFDRPSDQADFVVARLRELEKWNKEARDLLREALKGNELDLNRAEKLVPEGT